MTNTKTPCCDVLMVAGQQIYTCESCGAEICTSCSSDDTGKLICSDGCPTSSDSSKGAK